MRMAQRAGLMTALATTAWLAVLSSPAEAQLRIVSYNTNTVTSSSTFGTSINGVNRVDYIEDVLEAIGVESRQGIARPIDVLNLQEQLSVTGSTQIILDRLNSIYGAGTYARTQTNAFSIGGGRPTMIYNTNTVELIEEIDVPGSIGSGSLPPREAQRYQLRPVGYDSSADFYVYNAHFRASNNSSGRTARDIQATQIRANADALGQGASVILAGDLNFYRSTEAGWAELVGSGNGEFFDPINRIGSWSNNNSFRDVHTQSPVNSSQFGGQTTGGMDDRFDFQLTTAELLDNEGMSYIQGTYRAFGNNGSHPLNGDIRQGNGGSSAVLTAIAGASDHLPVVADYQLPARMGVEVQVIATKGIVGNTNAAIVNIDNTAPVTTINGADELDYSLQASGDAVPSLVSGSIDATTNGDTEFVIFDTSTTGAKSATIDVNSTSQSVANGTFSQTINFDVFASSNASFATDSDLDSLTLDLGEVALGETGTASFDLFNLIDSAAGSEFTAALDFDGLSLTDSSGFFTTTLSDASFLDGQLAGDSQSFDVSFTPTTEGAFSATFSLNFSDEDILGAVSQVPLSLTVLGEGVVPFLLGDTNNDGRLNASDVTLLGRFALGTISEFAAYPGIDPLLIGDLNNNGQISATDVTQLGRIVLSGSGTGAGGFSGAAVPEPSSALLLLGSGVPALLMASRSRRCQG